MFVSLAKIKYGYAMRLKKEELCRTRFGMKRTKDFLRSKLTTLQRVVYMWITYRALDEKEAWKRNWTEEKILKVKQGIYEEIRAANEK